MSDQKLTIRLYREGDEHGIINLFQKIFGREITIDEWRWKYVESNPKKIYSSVAVHEDLGVVGHYGAICLPIVYKGNSAQCLTICDVMIHPRFKGIKTLKELSYLVPNEAVKDGIIIGYGFPNRDTLLKPALSLGIYENVEDVLEGNKKAAFHNDLTRYQYKLFPLDYSDIRIDHLWEMCKTNFPLAVVRDRRYLTWRYKNHPVFSYELWGLKKRMKKQLIGLAVLKKEEYRILIMDFVSAQGYLTILLKKMENYIYSSKKQTTSLWAPPFMEKPLKEYGFSIIYEIKPNVLEQDRIFNAAGEKRIYPEK